jgi:hypothetical protein
MQVRGSHVGSYLPSSGVWHHTQRYLKKGTSDRNIVHHLDFDAPTRENANVLPDDKVFFYTPLLHVFYSYCLVALINFIMDMPVYMTCLFNFRIIEFQSKRLNIILVPIES